MTGDPGLRPYQQRTLDELIRHDRYADWSEAGLGKTRTLLLAAGDDPATVIAPASVRDTLVWEREAGRLGLEPPAVISYHQAVRGIPDRPVLILDEHHRCKERKVSWADRVYEAAWRAKRVYGATGTPMPNAAFELWGQLRVLRPPDERGMKYYWPWMSQWFQPAPDQYTSYKYANRLLGCYHEPAAGGGVSQTCEHWQEFYAANIEGYSIRHLRDEVLPDLPPLSGYDFPLQAPMTRRQRAAYAELKKHFVTTIPESGTTIESLSDAGQFVQLHMLSTGLGCLDPEADPTHKESGKLVWLREYLRDLRKPVLIVVWFKNTAAAVASICDDLRLDRAMLGASASSKERGQMVIDFGAGKTPVLCASLQVVKEGVDGLQYGSDEVVLLERSWTPGDNEQTIRRLHRLGQERPVTARQLVTPNTVDELQWETAQGKRDHIEQVLRPVEVASLV